MSLRGQPNFKKKVGEFFKAMIEQNKNFEDMADDGAPLEEKELELYVERRRLHELIG